MRSRETITTGYLTLAIALCITAMPVQVKAQTVTIAPPPVPVAGPALIADMAADEVIKPLSGNIDPFGGNIDPFGGTIDPFGGNIDPFGGTIDPFGGNIDPFAGHNNPFGGAIDPFAGKAAPLTTDAIGKFWGGFASGWKSADTLLASLNGQAAGTNTLASVSQQMETLAAKSETFWGQRVQVKTNKSFRDGFLNPLLARFGVTLSDPASFQRLTASQRSALAFAWYDGLMEFSGSDRTDHWMATTRWNPSITRIQGSGADSVIGLLDGSIANDVSVKSNLVSSGGYLEGANAHGSAVISLIVGAHDGQGVQGIAPNASVVAYNPFDSSGTASWADIRKGIAELKKQNVSVINMSLGIPGYTFHPKWDATFNNASLRAALGNTVFVVAAGNDGSTQSRNIEWAPSSNLALIVVGSINPAGTISSFSNRPGSACFVRAGACTAGNELMNRFIVAPGELLLVSDGKGGVTRMSGTSFAAPLVSGAVTLLHDRWQWLAKYPKETADIILSTARDLGAPGVDAVYGRGVLDVQASQSPINFSSLEFYEYDKKTVGMGKARNVTEMRNGGVSGAWEAEGTFFYLIEKIGNTRRDFAVPLSTRLVGQKTSVNGSSEYFQSYVSARFQDWIKNGGKFSDVARYDSPDRGGWNFAMQASNPVNDANGQRIVAMPQTSLSFTDPAGRLTLSGGHGDGVRALAGMTGFGLKGDYDVSNGGVNPLLGFASGGAFMDADIAVAKNLRIAAGFTQNTLDHSRNRMLSQAQRQNLIAMESYGANAFNFRLTHTASDAAIFTLGYTKLNEKNGLLGVQSAVASDLDSGSNSDTITLGAVINLPDNFMVAASATGAVSKAARNQSLNTSGGGVLSSAYAVSLTKKGFFGKQDSIRLSFTQPLHIEKGALEFTSVQIADRSTGELGLVTQRFDITEKSRRLTSEILYSTPIAKSGEMSLFGRVDYRLNAAKTQNVDGLVIGGRVRLSF
jgi:Subtilase family